MIVPMKKVFLIVLESERKEALKKLRAAGLVHLEALQGSGAELVSLKSKLSQMESAYQILSDIKLPKDKTKTEATVKSEDMLDLSGKIINLTEQKKALENKIIQNTVEIERLAKWGDVNPGDFDYLADKNIHIGMYEIPVARYSSLPDEVKTIFVNEDKSNVRFLLITEEGKKPECMPAEAFQITMPSKSTEEMKKEIAEARKTISSIDNELFEDVAFIPALKDAIGKASKDVEFENVFSGMEKEDGENALAWLTGFVPTENTDTVKKLAESENWGFAAVDPSDDDEVPTKLKNNKFVSLIYPVTDFLGTVPGYQEYDISGWFLLFFGIFFGMIFGDGGYGLIITLAGVLGVLKTAGRGKPAPAMLLLTFIGLVTVLWGMVTCTWFGIEVALLPQWLKDLSLTNVPLFGQNFAISNVTSAESEEMSNLVSQNLQVFCFTLALIQLCIAHLKGILRNIKSPKLLADLGSLGMMFGLYFVVLNMVVDGERFPMPSWTIPVIGGGFALSFIFANYDGSIGASILESCKNIVSVLLGVVNNFSDIVSYIRLWAVGLAGSAISQTVNGMAGGMLGGAIMCAGILLLFFGHGLNMILNVLSVIVHGVRLNTLEFSGHLGMSWSGFKYEPFSETVNK